MTNAQQLAVGAPVHGRSTLPHKETAGLFIELFPFRISVNEADTFADLHAKVAQESLTFLSNAVPGSSGFETARAFDVVLNYITAQFGPFDGAATHCDWAHPQCGDRAHALRLQVQDFDVQGDFQLLFDMSRDCLPECEQNQLIEQFLRLLDAFVADPHRPIGSVPLLSEQQSQALLNITAPPRDATPTATVVTRFTQQAKQTPTALAVTDEDTVLSYAELDALSDRAARALLEQGLGPGTMACLVLGRSWEAVVAILAVLKTGAAYVPVDPNYPATRIRHMVQDSGAQVVIGGLSNDSSLGPLNATVWDVAELIRADFSDSVRPSHPVCPSPGDAAYVIYTSGSTGNPKGVVVEHRSLNNYLAWAADQYSEGERRDYPLFTSLSFDLTVTSLFVPLVTGGSLVIYRETPGQREMTVRRVIADNRVDVIKLTPAHLRLIQDMDFSVSRLKTFIVGGEDFKTNLALALHRRFAGAARIFNEYGPTEATVACMIHRYDPLIDVDASVPHWESHPSP